MFSRGKRSFNLWISFLKFLAQLRYLLLSHTVILIVHCNILLNTETPDWKQQKFGICLCPSQISSWFQFLEMLCFSLFFSYSISSFHVKWCWILIFLYVCCSRGGFGFIELVILIAYISVRRVIFLRVCFTSAKFLILVCIWFDFFCYEFSSWFFILFLF